MNKEHLYTKQQYLDMANELSHIPEKYLECITLLDKVISIDPTIIDAYEIKANVYATQNEDELVISNYTIAIELANSSELYDTEDLITLYEQRAGYFIHLKQYEKAISDFTAIYNLDTNNLRAIMYRGFIYEKLGQTTLATKDIDCVKTYMEASTGRSIEELRDILML
ncbi:hypothetical protein HX052_00885 [Myroides marinus]|uniref:hypothetical protein n=1 Tax=Myroides marinus TaxID=703342 RepID=UPI0025768C41|nr:hypothetical protein [Myroides marinus]MDM1370121.1 hypothetical protein [Myroides marinus]MDM1371162.1 hypothetical protein [Myroides marinus]MDM1374058.1 hypothetical protein [Myroides marinus]MDM1382676.1 hypothetical protein [Myroides marinus]MDM1388531.1 hypothetical protein [Myroides marinus]